MAGQNVAAESRSLRTRSSGRTRKGADGEAAVRPHDSEASSLGDATRAERSVRIGAAEPAAPGLRCRGARGIDGGGTVALAIRPEVPPARGRIPPPGFARRRDGPQGPGRQDRRRNRPTAAAGTSTSRWLRSRLERAAAPPPFPSPAEPPRSDSRPGPHRPASGATACRKPRTRSPSPPRPSRADGAGAAAKGAGRDNGRRSARLRGRAAAHRLADLAARFGSVSVVSTSRLNTDNHSPERSATSFTRPARRWTSRRPARQNEVLDFLRSRPEVAGINSYYGGLIHIDLNENVRAAGLPRPRPGPLSTSSRTPVAAPSPADGREADRAHRQLSPKNDSTAMTTTMSPTM